MKRPLEISTVAELDLQDARDWYDREQSGLGDDLLKEAEEFFERIEANPERYGYDEVPIRKVSLDRFPFVIYYEVLEMIVFVHAIHHTSRAPRLFTSRR